MAAIQRALIVGAGMAGMTLGPALKRCGIACEVVEIRPELTEPGIVPAAREGYLMRAGPCFFEGFSSVSETRTLRR